jgi:hypothetical protein
VAGPLPAAVVTAVEQAQEVSGVPDLRAKVSGMAQALGTFSDGESYTGMKLPNAPTGGIPTTPTQVALAVGGMVDVMKQFDAHGNRLASQGNVAGLLGKSPGLQALQDASAVGILASKG